MSPAAGLLVSLLASGPSAALPPRSPVVLELFTSEGCSSCPDADAVLRRLDRDQPVAAAQVIALELHVDYWNYLGWADPFSQPSFTQRQGAYASAFDKDGVYTPQLVIDGSAQLVGSQVEAALQGIAAAAQKPKAEVAIRRTGAGLGIDIASAPDRDEVVLLLAETGLSSQVTRGENAGRTLEHGPVVRALRHLGSTHGETHFAPPLDLPFGLKPERAQAVVLIQDPKTLHIHGAALLDLRP